MKHEHKRDLVVIVSSLLGIAVGYVWRHPDATAADVGGTGEAALASTGDAAPFVSASALFAAATLSQRVGDMLAVRPDNLPAQSALAFAIGLGLSYYADTLKSFIPGLGGGKRK